MHRFGTLAILLLVAGLSAGTARAVPECDSLQPFESLCDDVMARERDVIRALAGGADDVEELAAGLVDEAADAADEASDAANEAADDATHEATELASHAGPLARTMVEALGERVDMTLDVADDAREDAEEATHEAERDLDDGEAATLRWVVRMQTSALIAAGEAAEDPQVAGGRFAASSQADTLELAAIWTATLLA